MNELNYQMDLLKAMNQKLTTKEKMYTMICEASNCAYLYFSFEKNQIVTIGRWREFFDFDIADIKDVNRVFDEMEEEYTVPLRDVIFLEKSGKGISAMECKHKDGKGWYSFRTTVDYDNLGNPQDKLIVVENTTRIKTQHEELIYMAHYDTMTSLYNRNYFVTLLHDYMKKAERERSVISVMVIDIDDFKKVNDGMGMLAGDELLQLFGAFIKELTRENVFACHLNNDVYCIAIYDPSIDCNVEQIHKMIRRRTADEFVLSNKQSVKISVSIGVAEYPEAASTPLELINCAEIVMYRCKSAGKNMMKYFDASILNDFLKNIELDNKLREAAFHNNFELYYQPQFYTGNKKLRGMEALIRWKDEDNNMISPNVFIPIAEKNGCIIPIGDWVIEESIRTFAGWREKYKTSGILSINISAVQYNKTDFVDSLLLVIRKYHVDPGMIEIEITESVLIEDFDNVIDKLKILRSHGVRVSLDDFGTGFSSLSYLKKLPIDTLKIDKSFIDTVLSDSATRIITESIINMVKSLGIESIAEGVEEQAQYDYLHAIGCDMIQGYLLGKPQTAEEIEGLLNG
ncbi:MAG: bifunctional diguanylate cyclase/phosphodiesterase [Lachnospiraceae bacterium]|nr:bifunctional diguanylate cyclase/phosphodiesterase [Lachnospiraceae bacterium]